MAQPGTLYLVPTPIGNPADITLRALDVLREAGLVAAEDTRHTRNLLKPHGIEAKLVSYHDHNEQQRMPQLLAALRDGMDVALVSDAGTPLVNDPGYRVVAAAIGEGIRVSPLPGANAPITALIGSGLPVHRFQYVGFLPRSAGQRQSALRDLRDVDATLLFFEAPHRIPEAVADMAEVLGDRDAVLASNLTKADESFLRGSLGELAERVTEPGTVRGQYTLVVDGAGEAGDAEHAFAERLIGAMLERGADPRLTRDVVRDVTGLPRNWVYEAVSAAQRS